MRVVFMEVQWIIITMSCISFLNCDDYVRVPKVHRCKYYVYTDT